MEFGSNEDSNIFQFVENLKVEDKNKTTTTTPKVIFYVINKYIRKITHTTINSLKVIQRR